MADDEFERRTEAWFLDRGLPHFTAQYRASTDIWTRALPALTLLVLFEVAVLAPSRDFPFWLDVIAVGLAFAALLGLWALLNRARGRPALARPVDLGPLEVAAFVVVPALAPLASGGQIGQALATAAINVVILGVIYLFTSYAIISMTRWGLGRLVGQLEAIVSLLARALPLIALLVTFLFLTNEVWQTAGALDGAPYWLAVALFPLVGLLFLGSRMPTDLRMLNEFTDVGEIEVLTRDTPVGATTGTDLEHIPPLSRREWNNVVLVALFSQGVQIIIVSLLIGVFFVVIGLLLVDASTTVDWARQVNVLVTISMGERHLVVTEELLRVAGFLTAFSGLNFTVYLVTDETYRREFRDEVLAELRQAFAVRAAYRARLDRASAASATISPT